MDKNSFKILQWNCRSIKNKLDFLNIASEYDIILLVETWLNDTDNFNLKGFTVVRFDRLYGGGGGLAICIKNSISYVKTSLNFNSISLETGSITVDSPLGEILISVCYRSPIQGNNISAQEWDQFQNAIKSHKAKNFIIGGDFNGHHPLWGSDRTCTNGKIIVENLDYENFVLLNDNSPTHVTLSPNGLSFSNIDLTFISTGLAINSNWYVTDDKKGSDHFPIIIEVNAKIIFTQKPDYRYNLKKMDWGNFISLLNSKKSYFNSDEFLNLDPLSRYDNFIEVLNDSILESLPKNKKNQSTPTNIALKNNNSKPNCLWWNDNCDKVIRQRKAAVLSIKHRFTMDKFIEVKRIEALTKKTLKEEKKKSWDQFCETISPNTKIKDFWRKIKLYKNATNKYQNIGNPKEQECNIKKTIDSLCAPKHNVINPLKYISDIVDNDGRGHVLNNLNITSAPGADKISYDILSALPEFHRRILLDIYNDFFHFKLFPDQWKQYLVIFIPKGNSNKVRPISLASCMLKIMEKLIKERLQWWLEANGILTSTQFGFRRGKSCVDNLSILTSDIHQSFFKKQSLSALFLDIKGAYDNVVPEILINDLIELGLRIKIVAFIKNLICMRKVTFCTNFSLIDKLIVKGLPQGSILSPLLYSIYTSKLEDYIINSTKILQFADNIVLYNNDNKTALDQIQSIEASTDVLLPFLSNKSLDLAPDKCVLMVL